MITTVSPFATEAIIYLINKSLSEGEFPQTWKKSIIRSLQKVTTSTCVEHLRPIHILPEIYKIL